MVYLFIILGLALLLFLAYKYKQSRNLTNLRRKLEALSFIKFQVSELSLLVTQNSKSITGNWYQSIDAYYSKNELIFIQKSIFHSFDVIDYIPIAVVKDPTKAEAYLHSEKIFEIKKFISIKNRIYMTAIKQTSSKQKLEINFRVDSEEQLSMLSMMRDWIDF